VAKALETAQPHAVRKDIELSASLPAALTPVNGDEGTLVEVLVNLLGNAVKYTRNGGQVTVRAEAAGGEVLIAVADTGVGIAKEDLPHIFDDFYRGAAGRTTDQSGGLGLAIVRRIVEAHYGSISVESEAGRGSTFTIRLPALKTKQHP
jgi:two-component system sensor histidine kinase BaeS